MGNQFAMLLFVYILCLSSGLSNGLFEWETSSWSECRADDSKTACCRKCVQTRNITCQYKAPKAGANGTITSKEYVTPPVKVAPFHCQDLSKPKSHRKCRRCKQDCVLTAWSSWSRCGLQCNPLSRHRTRQVLIPAEYGGDCYPLWDEEPCMRGVVKCSLHKKPENYTWKVGAWTSCRKPLSYRTLVDCGQGMRERQVTCVDQMGQKVAAQLCEQNLTGRPKPAESEYCAMPCDCTVSEWSNWGACSQTCLDGSRHARDGTQTRKRSVTRLPKLGGLNCPPLHEMRACTAEGAPQCPRYEWFSGEWNECYLAVNSSQVCGSGHQTRQVYCAQVGDPLHRPVDEQACRNDGDLGGFQGRPPVKRACHVTCPQDCQLGEWTNWGACSKSCGSTGIRSREKPVLVAPSSGGLECGTRTQFRECEPTECYSFYHGRWSTCLLEDSKTTCGQGSMIRTVYCRSSRDEVVEDDLCAPAEKPPERSQCKVPCADECVVSDWSDWGPCSKSCFDRISGLRHRKRQILAHGNSSSPCLSEAELSETQACNVVRCTTFMWQVNAWGACERRNQNTTQCGENLGISYRTVLCQDDAGNAVEEKLCDIESKPDMVKRCTSPCPQHCALSEWSEWSDCSKTCGSGHMLRHRHVLQLPLHGGDPCPAEANENGMISERRKCRNSVPCYTFSWRAESWGECQFAEGECGHGVQERNVSCVRSDDTVVTMLTSDQEAVDKSGWCLGRVLSLPPSTQQRCFVPCPGDCSLSGWSEFSPCTQTCGDKPGSMTRMRHIINLGAGIPTHIQCPHITEQDLHQTVVCGNQSCPTYSWEMGPWQSCILHNHKRENDVKDCHGVQRRNLLCKRNDGVYVSDDFCDEVLPTPDKHQRCHLVCPIDCAVSQWSDWSVCSQHCGTGVMTRQRRILVHPRYGGRPCPKLSENTTCVQRDCTGFEWKVSQWGLCKNQHDFRCGAGRQSRNVSCPAGSQFEEECAMRSPRPISEQDCDLPCTGDCVMSEWSEFIPCQCGQNGTFKSRTRTRGRTILRKPATRGHPCGRLEELDVCTCRTFKLQVGAWTSCQLKESEMDCGPGMRNRPVNCVRNDGVTVSRKYCHSESVPKMEPCEIPCPVDCELSEFTDWSDCSAECGVEAYKSRQRSILVRPNELGRKCRNKNFLFQNTTCHTRPCYSYSWLRGDWSECKVEGQGCGYGVRTRAVECVRSDGQQAQKLHCLLEAYKGKSGEETMSALSNLDEERMDIETEQSCGSPCPGDCQVSTWSELGPCFKKECNAKEKGQRAQSRPIIRPAAGGQPCPDRLLSTKSCSKSETVCPVFFWTTGEWDETGHREVWCSLQTGLNVTGGCLVSNRPATSKICIPECGENAICVEGTCLCLQGFTGDGFECLPSKHCHDDVHCVEPHTVCNRDSGRCVCSSNGLQPQDETGGCLPLLLVSGMGNYAEAPDLTEPAAAAKDDSQLGFIIGVAVGGLVVIILVIVVIFLIIRRRRQRMGDLRVNPPKFANNLDMWPRKNNELEVAPPGGKYTNNASNNKNIIDAAYKLQNDDLYRPNISLNENTYNNLDKDGAYETIPMPRLASAQTQTGPLVANGHTSDGVDSDEVFPPGSEDPYNVISPLPEILPIIPPRHYKVGEVTKVPWQPPEDRDEPNDSYEGMYAKPDKSHLPPRNYNYSEGTNTNDSLDSPRNQALDGLDSPNPYAQINVSSDPSSAGMNWSPEPLNLSSFDDSQPPTLVRIPDLEATPSYNSLRKDDPKQRDPLRSPAYWSPPSGERVNQMPSNMPQRFPPTEPCGFDDRASFTEHSDKDDSTESSYNSDNDSNDDDRFELEALLERRSELPNMGLDSLKKKQGSLPRNVEPPQQDDVDTSSLCPSLELLDAADKPPYSQNDFLGQEHEAPRERASSFSSSDDNAESIQLLAESDREDIHPGYLSQSSQEGESQDGNGDMFNFLEESFDDQDSTRANPMSGSEESLDRTLATTDDLIPDTPSNNYWWPPGLKRNLGGASGNDQPDIPGLANLDSPQPNLQNISPYRNAPAGDLLAQYLADLEAPQADMLSPISEEQSEVSDAESDDSRLLRDERNMRSLQSLGSLRQFCDELMNVHDAADTTNDSSF